MEDVRKNISTNIARLRKEKKWTQAELAEHLNYSDKAISKWERGESVPDVDSLFELSKIFEVQVDYFFYHQHQEQFLLPTNTRKIRNLLLLILLCVAAFTLSTAIFVFGCYRDGNVGENAKIYWVSFVWAVPVCALLCSIYFSRHFTNDPRAFLISLSIVLWGILAGIFLNMLIYDLLFWMVFLFGIPIQAALIIAHFMRK